MVLLTEYSFSGNIEELENIIERAMIMCKQSTIEKNVLYFHNKEDIEQRTGTLKQMEKEMIKKYLIQNNGNRTKTAQELGISRRNLQLKIKEYYINFSTYNVQEHDQ